MEVGNILLAAVGIGLLIFIHELGHFLAARLAGVRVEIFSLGFGPRVFGAAWRGTDFRVSLVPFGGYVMVAGQDPGDRRYPRSESLWAKSAGQRALFWSGGVLMNALFALLVFPLVFRAGVSFEAPVIGQVDHGGAAWEAGLQPGDRVAAIAGKSIYAIDNLMVEAALAGGRPVALEIVAADGSRRVVTATPQFDAAAGLFGLGIRPAIDPEPPTIVVTADGPAAAAGLRTGDQLLAVDGEATAPYLPDSLAPGVPATVAVRRAGETLQVTVTPRPLTEGVPPRIGVRAISRVVKGLRPGSALVERLGLQRGDIVLAIDGAPFLGGDLAVAADGPPRTRWLVERAGQRVVLEQAATAAERAALVDHVALTIDPKSLLVAPTDAGPAAAAGLRAGDRIVRVDDRVIATWPELVATVEAADGRPLHLQVLRLPVDAAEDALAHDAGTPVELVVAPRREPLPDLGFDVRLLHLQDEIKAESIGAAVRLGTVCSLDLVKQLYVTLKRLITGDVAAKNLGGIIRISQVSYHAAQRGASWFWYFLALLSVNLAFVNLLPVPVLDGGYLLFLLIEKVKGSPVSTRVLGYSQIVGLVFVLLLVLFVTYNDILRLL
ncbi:MAG: RIP metalloprotease RseP [Planctomycetes bacterium]|nr:RIP metalloprotease RseP [Planctomycetota bacterium]